MASILVGVVQEAGDGFIRLDTGAQIRVPPGVWTQRLAFGVRVSLEARLLGAEWVAEDIDVLQEQPQPRISRVETAYETLRSLIRAKLADQRISRDASHRVWGAEGNGDVCVACDQPVNKPQIVIVEAEPPTRRFHVECFSIWDHERQTRC